MYYMYYMHREGPVARPINHGGGAYEIPLTIKMNTEAIAALDALRGDVPRSTYLRDLLRAEQQRGSTEGSG